MGKAFNPGSLNIGTLYLRYGSKAKDYNIGSLVINVKCVVNTYICVCFRVCRYMYHTRHVRVLSHIIILCLFLFLIFMTITYEITYD